MAASGITLPSQRNGKSKSAELAAAAKAAQAAAAAAAAQAAASSAADGRGLTSPLINNAASTPSPGQGSGSNPNQFFHFEVCQYNC